jgi:hypothetical protein
VERINQFEFFDLGEKLQEMKSVAGRDELLANDALFPLWTAHTSVDALVGGKPLELSVSKACAMRLRDALWAFLEKYCREAGADGRRTWKFQDADAAPVPSYAVHDIDRALSDFETVFREEMREAAIYRVPRRGIWDIAKLIDAADESFPAEIAMVIPQKSRDDWRAAGRCMAFNLFSASGFHVARSVEGMLESYYQQAHSLQPSDKRATLKSWNDYIVALEAAQKAEPTKGPLAPTDKVISELRQMKDDYRNPIAHPRIVLSESDARMLFANGESLIIAMGQEMKAVMPKPSSALAGIGLVPNALLKGGEGTT